MKQHLYTVLTVNLSKTYSLVLNLGVLGVECVHPCVCVYLWASTDHSCDPITIWEIAIQQTFIEHPLCKLFW